LVFLERRDELKEELRLRFIEKAKTKHGDTYMYDKVIYVNSKTKVLIGCRKHGYFEQKMSKHLAGQGCRKCADGPKRTTEDFIKGAILKHGDKYDYSKSVYKNIEKNVIIICPEHGEFQQTPHSHLRGGGCPVCARITATSKFRTSTEEFIRKAKLKWGDKYSYTKTKYVSTAKKLIITCPIHGNFEQRADGHLKYGCEKCHHDGRKISFKEFLERANKLHGDKYEYNENDYVDASTKIPIKCKKHGIFHQRPSDQMAGYGCPVCKGSKGEYRISEFLNSLDIKFISQYRIGKTAYRYDFHIRNTSILIEYDGIQHFIPVSFFGGEDEFYKTKKRDKAKNLLADMQGYNLIRIPYTRLNDLEDYLLTQLRRYIKYRRDGKYFKNFLEFAKHYSLSGDATPKEYKQYLF